MDIAAFNTTPVELEKELEKLIMEDRIQARIGTHYFSFNHCIIITTDEWKRTNEWTNERTNERTIVTNYNNLDGKNMVLYAKHVDERQKTFEKTLSNASDFVSTVYSWLFVSIRFVIRYYFIRSFLFDWNLWKSILITTNIQ